MFYERYPELDRLLLSYPGAERDFQPVWGWDRYLVAGKMYAGLLFIAKHSDPRYKGHMFLSSRPGRSGVLPYPVSKRCFARLLF